MYNSKIAFIIGIWIVFFTLSCSNQETLNADRVANDSITIRNNYNSLSIYQVMVEAYQDGSPDYDYNTGYGPSDHKGDLKGITNALPYIKSLNVNAVWLTPIFNSDGDSRLDATGYFCKDYFHIDPKFGTLQDARDLVEKAHELGLYVFFDGVFGHHKQGILPSPTGKLPEGPNSPVSYPGSLEFYKEVATYWFDELEIDGWRLDQCYQVSLRNQDKNYWEDIREAVQVKCNQRKQEGKKWGTLGYMVGEDWESPEDIQKNSYSGDGLQSAFDFPSRYKIVQVLACDANKKISDQGAEIFSEVFATPTQKGYTHKNGVFPNLFIGNHDLVRFGNLINWRYGLTRNDDDYWKIHKCALSLLAAYTGPVSLYYGDEYGDILDGWSGHGEAGIANDNVGRSNGKIAGFTTKELDLVDYTSSILGIRKNNSALFNGAGTNLISNKDIYCDYKINDANKVIYMINIANDDTTIMIGQKDVGGSKLVNLENNTPIIATNGNYDIEIAGLSAGFYLVSD